MMLLLCKVEEQKENERKKKHNLALSPTGSEGTKALADETKVIRTIVLTKEFLMISIKVK